MNDITTPLVQTDNGELWTTSLIIAETFGRNHKNVLRSIDELIADGMVDRLNFEPISFTDSMNREQRAIRLDERDFLTAMPFIGGRKARQGQVQLVDAFLTLRAQHQAILEGRLDRIDQTLFQKHPLWQVILEGKTQGLSHSQILKKTGYRCLDTIRRNLRRMESFGLLLGENPQINREVTA